MAVNNKIKQDLWLILDERTGLLTPGALPQSPKLPENFTDDLKSLESLNGTSTELCREQKNFTHHLTSPENLHGSSSQFLPGQMSEASKLASLSRISIVKDGHPDLAITTEEFQTIKLDILEKLNKMSMPPFPKIHSINLESGSCIVTCGDEFTETWLRLNFHGVLNLTGCALKVLLLTQLPKPVKVALRTQDMLSKDPDLLLQRIRMLNPHLKNLNWRLLLRTEESEYAKWIFEIDCEAADAIKAGGFRAFTGLDNGVFVILSDPREKKTTREESSSKGVAPTVAETNVVITPEGNQPKLTNVAAPSVQTVTYTPSSIPKLQSISGAMPVLPARMNIVVRPDGSQYQTFEVIRPGLQTATSNSSNSTPTFQPLPGAVPIPTRMNFVVRPDGSQKQIVSAVPPGLQTVISNSPNSTFKLQSLPAGLQSILRTTAPQIVSVTGSSVAVKSFPTPVTVVHTVLQKTSTNVTSRNTPTSTTPSSSGATSQKVVCSVLKRKSAKTTARKSLTNAAQSSLASMSPNTMKKKCVSFLTTLIKLSGDPASKTGSNVRKLIHNLIVGTIQPEEFSTELRKKLTVNPQPNLIPFLKKSLPLAREALMTKEMSIEGIDPLPLPAHLK